VGNNANCRELVTAISKLQYLLSRHFHNYHLAFTTEEPKALFILQLSDFVTTLYSKWLHRHLWMWQQVSMRVYRTFGEWHYTLLKCVNVIVPRCRTKNPCNALNWQLHPIWEPLEFSHLVWLNKRLLLFRNGSKETNCTSFKRIRKAAAKNPLCLALSLSTRHSTIPTGWIFEKIRISNLY
jgi:hypothetical protein